MSAKGSSNCLHWEKKLWWCMMSTLICFTNRRSHPSCTGWGARDNYPANTERGSGWSAQPRDACCFPCWCHYIATEIIPTANLPAVCYGWWGCSTGPKASPSNRTLLIQKWKALPWNLHQDPKQLRGTGEAPEKQVPLGAPCFQTFFVPLWWTLMA